MGQLWRSEEMRMIQLYIQRDSAHDTVYELGELGVIQFRDLNPAVNAFQRNFVNEVKRCDELERKLRYFLDQIHKEEAEAKKTLKEILIETGAGGSGSSGGSQEAPKGLDMDELEGYLEGLEKELRQMNNNQEALARNYNEYREMYYVLTKDATFFEQASSSSSSSSAAADSEQTEDHQTPLLAADESASSAAVAAAAASGVLPAGAGVGVHTSRIGFVTGVVLSSRCVFFERVLWRALHGNMYFRTSDIEEPLVDPATGDPVSKVVFVVFYHGDQSLVKIRKICDAFGARICACPDSRAGREDLVEQVNTRLGDMKQVLSHSVDHRRRLLGAVGQSVETWMRYVRKEKSVYSVMNAFNYDLGRKCLIAEGWCPAKQLDNVRAALRTATSKAGASVAPIMNEIHTEMEPPTYYITTEFTNAFQEIVNAYGVARYGEVNPTVPAVITFPFLFAVMFGDFGHAILMLAASSAIVGMSGKLRGKRMNEIFSMVFGGRYLILLMSMFSLYTGLLYNETFSVPLNIFGSHFHDCESGHCVKYTNRTYPFGVDPMWRGSDNELYYYNSLKMKLSIIFGVIQMLLGVVISCLNHLHFGRYADVLLVFIPELLFMLCVFGYLTALIVFKWFCAYTMPNQPYLINVLIDMFLQFPGLPAEELMYSGQKYVQNILVVIAVLSAVVLLLGKPLWTMFLRKRRAASVQHHQLPTTVGSLASEDGTEPASASAGGSAGGSAEAGKDVGEGEGEGEGEGQGHEEAMSDLWVHQAIHTIEYCLGCISNTASYLRLWALSLAHSELSVVAYDMVLLLTIKIKLAPAAFIGFAVWAIATVGILLCMEALSAFLHALRLHWVEFMNKFYAGDGYIFAPFSHQTIIAQLGEEMIAPAPSSDS